MALWVRHLPLARHRRGDHYADRTIRTYSQEIAAFAAWCGELPLDALTEDVVLRHEAELRDAGRAASYIATRDKVVRLFLGWCRERGMLAVDPLAAVPRARAEDPPVEALSDADVHRLLAACPITGSDATWAGLRQYAIVYVLWRCGLRASELCGLEIEDYDRHKGHLRVRGRRPRDAFGRLDERSESREGKKSAAARRTVGVPDDARAALEDWLVRARGMEPGRLFPGERGDDLRREALTVMLARLARRAGVTGVHPHRLRHTFALNYLRADGDLYTLARLLGHSTLQMTTKYLRALQAEEAADRHVQVMRRRWGNAG